MKDGEAGTEREEVSIPLRKFRVLRPSPIMATVSIPLRKFRKGPSLFPSGLSIYGFHPSKEV